MERLLVPERADSFLRAVSLFAVPIRGPYSRSLFAVHSIAALLASASLVLTNELLSLVFL